MRISLSKLMAGAVLAGSLTLASGCEDFLDVNTNPNGPEVVSANLYLSPMLHWMVTSPLYEGRFVGRYTQQWTLPATTLSTWDRMGYDPGSDNGAQQWRDVYWSLGQNLVDMMDKAEAEERWDLLGVGYILKAWGWLALTDTHGEIIIKEAFNQGASFSFNYDTQEYAYQEIDRLLKKAIELLQRTDGAVDAGYLGRTDIIYGGDRTKWLKFAYGLQAMQLNHFTNKASYKPADVIAAVDKSFTSNADDALLAYPATVNDDRNFYGWTRDNLRSYRQTKFVVELMNGTQFGGVVDPRMSRMLSASPDGQYRGYDVSVPGTTAFPTTAPTVIPNNFFGYAGTGGQGLPSKYIFSDKSRLPAMTYSQLQFIKAEAAYRMGDKAMALTAFRNGVQAHLLFVNARNTDDGQYPTPISTAEQTAFMSSAAVPSTPGALTLTHIMSQKYIAQWAWAHNELWLDMRRYHYTDVDPASGMQVFPGFAPPSTTNLYPDNGGKIAQRIRPRYNSEYVWNRPGLDAIGGLATDYHTKPLWITQP